MKTPLIMLLILTLPLLVVMAIPVFRVSAAARHRGATLGLSLLFTFTATGHFVETAAMSEMLPDWVPGRIALVHATGVLEILVAAGQLWRRTRRVAARSAIFLLVAFFPCNIYAAVNHVPMGGHAWGPIYLLVRAPLQGVIIAWTWLLVLRSAAGAHAGDDSVQAHRRHAEVPRQVLLRNPLDQ